VNRPIAVPLVAGVVISIVAILFAAGSDGRVQAQSVPSPAVAYLQAVNSIVDNRQTDLAHVTAVANAAADVYVRDGESIGAAGDPMFVWELSARAGGLRQIEAYGPFSNPAWKGLVLYGLPTREVSAAATEIAAIRGNGVRVILFGTSERMDELHRRGIFADWEISNFATSQERVCRNGSACLAAPVNGVANIVAGWQFTAEFVAALTRRGKMPSVWQSAAVNGAVERNASLASVRLHSHEPRPSAEGALGTEYVDQLRRQLALLNDGELANIENLASHVTTARKSGAQAYVLRDGHAVAHALAQEGVPTDTFVDGNVNIGDVHPKPADLVFLLGYNRRYSSAEWERIARESYSVGAKVAYSFAIHDDGEVAALTEGDLLIRQHWGIGDAEVAVPDYDVKMFPVSGVIQNVILYMIMANSAAATQP